MIDRKQWFKLPLGLRQRWWNETAFGQLPPSPELIDALKQQGLIMSFYTDIKNFHEKFGLEYDGKPRFLPKDLSDFRKKFMAEELEEYEDTNLEKQLDALVDLAYVAIGTAYLHGFDFDEAWRRVHEANMKKVRAQSDGSDSVRKSSHDVVKPAGWTAPDLSDLVA